MTRKSKREIERALEQMEERYGRADPDSARTPKGWVERHLERALTAGNVEFNRTGVHTEHGEPPHEGITEPDRTGEVCILGGDVDSMDFWVPEEKIPDWIDPEEDLPI